ncbi:PD-(D/E)XK nuclease-like domain-containing protein [Paenibacillus larvae]|uniref:PD-(D/E)XK nuclease-like domain-containing protein n=2 Tax=Paenibacillus larvae TaxID=1464 RepID=UPI002692F914
MMFQLNNQNYHSNESNKQYFSNSQYKDFLTCEAMAMAKINGWQQPFTDSLLIGSYVHAYFEGPEAFDEFKETNPGIFSSRGRPKEN